jgi:hypothetical protein
MDILFLIETWLSESSNVVIGELCPPGYGFLNMPRGDDHGGLGLLFKRELKPQIISLDFNSVSFEYVIISNSKRDIYYVLVYRTYPSVKNGFKTSQFLSEYDDFLIQVNSMSGKVVMLGDFNFHCDLPEKSEVAQFLAMIEGAGFCQLVNGPTHIGGHTLDLVIVRLDDNLIRECEIGPRFSDHNIISCRLTIKKTTQNVETFTARKFSNIDKESFQNDLGLRFRPLATPVADVNNLSEAYEKTVIETLDQHAPLVTRTRNARIRQPWYNSEIHQARRLRRKHEKKWRKTRLEIHHQLYIEHNITVNSLIEKAKKSHYAEKFQGADDTKTMYKIVYSLLNSKCKILPGYESAEDMSNEFAMYFQNKVSKIYEDLDQEVSGTGNVSVNMFDHDVSKECGFSVYDHVTDEDVRRLIQGSATKSCLLDPVPTWLIKEHLSVFVPVITCIINASISTGVFPSSLKHAVINPLIKKQSLNPNELKSYRPVANIPFLSKLIEKHVVNNINKHMLKHQLGEELQSAYMRGHSTETALLKVKDEIMGHVYNQKGVFLVLLDLSAAFDTVKHDLLLSRMSGEIGVTGIALDWLKSYFTGRTTSVVIDGKCSMAKTMDYGLPQGSILGPRGFTVYTIPIGRIIKRHSLSYHMYADDIQIFCSFEPSNPSSIDAALSSITSCIKDIRTWMTFNFLKLNNDKTEFLVVTSPHFKRQMPDVCLNIGDEIIRPSTSVRNLGIIFDDVMSMLPQITSLSKNITFHLRNITRIRRFLDNETCIQVVQSLVISRLDYGNVLLTGANSTHIMKLQRLQNWSAKIIFCASKRDHASQYLQELHWLPVKQRMLYKLFLYVYKCLNGYGPNYLASSFSLYNQSRSGLRSAADITSLSVPKYNPRGLQSAFGRSFTLTAPALWNALPSNLRCAASLPSFKKGLKTHLFPK